MSDPVLDPDPTWIKKVLDPTGLKSTTLVQLIFIFQVCTHAQLSLSQFLLPAYTFYFFETSYFAARRCIDCATGPAY